MNKKNVDRKFLRYYNNNRNKNHNLTPNLFCIN